MKLRTIKFNDAFTLSKIIDKLQIKFEKGLKTDIEVGADFILKIIQNAHKAQNEVNDFMGSLFAITGEEFGKLPIKTVFDCFNELANSEDFKDFFKSVAKFANMK